MSIALVSMLLTIVDTIQSFYLQRVINVFSEANLLPRAFYGFGVIGYLAYVPIEFATVFATLALCWLWATYALWYHRNIVAKHGSI